MGSAGELSDRIVLFDGVCNYCNAMVNFAIRNDKNAVLRFTALQSETGMALRKKFNIDLAIDSLIFIEHNKAFTYADAALKICRHLDWPAKMLSAFAIIPSFICNPVYKWIAKNRYKWFGKKETCMIPTPDVKSRFIS
jgi:predicted DCC family thiol-disulfide oxidoreductase YuxK